MLRLILLKLLSEQKQWKEGLAVLRLKFLKFFAYLLFQLHPICHEAFFPWKKRSVMFRCSQTGIPRIVQCIPPIANAAVSSSSSSSSSSWYYRMRSEGRMILDQTQAKQMACTLLLAAVAVACASPVQPPAKASVRCLCCSYPLPSRKKLRYPTWGSWENHRLKSAHRGWEMLVPSRGGSWQLFFLEAPLGDGISRIQKQQLQSPGVTRTRCQVVSVRVWSRFSEEKQREGDALILARTLLISLPHHPKYRCAILMCPASIGSVALRLFLQESMRPKLFKVAWKSCFRHGVDHPFPIWVLRVPRPKHDERWTFAWWLQQSEIYRVIIEKSDNFHPVT